MSASDDEDLAEENKTPGGTAAVEQLGGLEEKRDNDLTPTSETKLEGMIKDLSGSIAMLYGGMDRIQQQVNELEVRSVPTPPKEERTPRRTERRQSVIDDLLQSSRKLQWADVLDRGYNKGREDDEDSEEESLPDNISRSKRHSDSRESVETSRVPRGKLFQEMRESVRSTKRTVQVTRVEKECTVKITYFRLGSVAKAMRDIPGGQE